MKFVRPLAKNDGSVVMRRDFLEVLRDNGLNYDDPRLERMIEELSVEENEAIPIDTLIEIAGLGGQTVLDALSGDMVIPKFKAFKDDCWQIFEAVKNVSGGKNAEYIPQLVRSIFDVCHSNSCFLTFAGCQIALSLAFMRCVYEAAYL